MELNWLVTFFRTCKYKGFSFQWFLNFLLIFFSKSMVYWPHHEEMKSLQGFIVYTLANIDRPVCCHNDPFGRPRSHAITIICFCKQYLLFKRTCIYSGFNNIQSTRCFCKLFLVNYNLDQIGLLYRHILA